MTSRERVAASLNHHEPDKVPIDFGGTPSSGISVIAYNNLTRYLDCYSGKVQLYDIYQQLALPEQVMIDRMGSDVVLLPRLKPRFDIPLDKWKEWKLKDGSKCLIPGEFEPEMNEQGDLEIIAKGIKIAKMPNNGYYFDIIHNPHEWIQSFDHIDSVEFPNFDMGELDYLQRKAKHLYDNTPYAIVGSFGGSFVELGQRYWGFEKFMTEMLLDEDLMIYWLDKLAKSHIANLQKYLAAVGKYINVIQFSDDLGTQESLIMSKAVYRRIFKPFHSRICRFVHANYPHIKVLLHCCGSISELIPDFIEAGVDAMNPVQITARNMDPQKLKSEHGKDLIFWGGGADMQFTANSGTLNDIRKNVKELIDIFKPGGGFIFTQVHNIQENVSPQKILAIYETALQNRDYSILSGGGQ